MECPINLFICVIQTMNFVCTYAYIYEIKKYVYVMNKLFVNNFIALSANKNIFRIYLETYLRTIHGNMNIKDNDYLF